MTPTSSPATRFWRLLLSAAVLLALLTIAALVSPSAAPVGKAAPSALPQGSAPAAVPPASAARPIATPSIPPSQNVWNRMKPTQVVKVEERAGVAGETIKTSLIDVPGKSPRALVRETTVTDPSTGISRTRQVAMAAGHVLVQAGANVSAGTFSQMIARQGLQVESATSTPGLYLVKVDPNDVGAVDRAIGTLAKAGAVKFAEPDYFVFSADIPEERRMVQASGAVLIDPVSASVASPTPVISRPAADPAFLAQEQSRVLATYPTGTRVIGFDSPYFTAGIGDYRPYLTEQNMRISADAPNDYDKYIYVQNSYTSGYGNNGGNYIRRLTSQTNLTVQHSTGLHFQACGLDISEYAAGYSATNVTVTGYKATGGTVVQSFLTDGINDGTGPAADFQSFTLNSNFTDLTKITITSASPFMIDNIAVLVDGQDSPPPPALDPPLIYDVSFDAPKHAVGQMVAVGGTDAPTTVNFGSPTVRAAVGPMTGPALELKSGIVDPYLNSTYQQVQFNLARNAQIYQLAFDACIKNADEFTVLLDGPAQGSMIDALRFYPSSTSSQLGGGNYPQNQVFHVDVTINLGTQQVTVLFNGVPRSTFTLSRVVTDLADIRFHLTGSASSGALVGLDNIKISASGIIPPSQLGPRLDITTTKYDYPTTSVGAEWTFYLSFSNTGGQTLTVPSITSSNPAWTIGSTFPITVLPGGNFSAPMKFKPLVGGAVSGTVTMTSNDPAKPTVAVAVTGTGIGGAQVEVAPSSLALTMPVGTTAQRPLTIKNTGGSGLTWSIVRNATRPLPGQAPDPAVTPADPSFSSLWAMKDPLVNGAGIDATHAWSLTHGSAVVEVGIIDTGIDSTHPDLTANVDVTNGRNFITNLGNGMDDYGHGTHVAGTIAAVGNNQIGVVGVAWGSRLISLKFLNSSGSGLSSDAVTAFNYAASQHIPILNCSWGGGGYSQSLYDAIANCGGLVVASAGNDGSDNDLSPRYPSSYDCPNIIAVASTDSTDNLSYFSNFGAHVVDVAAPGSSILSSYLGGGYAYLSGTSMASPHVSGTAALLLSKNPSLSPGQLKQLLIGGIDAKAGLATKVVSGGRVNAYTTLRMSTPQWLTPGSTAGALGVGQTIAVPIFVSALSLNAGSYADTLYVESSDPLHPRVAFPIAVSVVPAGGFGSWQTANFGDNNALDAATATTWSETADPNHNGLPNLLEYALGTNPAVWHNSEPQTGTISDGNGNTYLALTYTCPNPAPADLTYVVETSSSLISAWAADVIEVSRTDNGNGTQTVVTRRTMPISTQNSAFLRLRVIH